MNRFGIPVRDSGQSSAPPELIVEHDRAAGAATRTPPAMQTERLNPSWSGSQAPWAERSDEQLLGSQVRQRDLREHPRLWTNQRPFGLFALPFVSPSRRSSQGTQSHDRSSRPSHSLNPPWCRTGTLASQTSLALPRRRPPAIRPEHANPGIQRLGLSLRYQKASSGEPSLVQPAHVEHHLGTLL